MDEAIRKVNDDGIGLRVVARRCNVPIETLRRRVAGSVSLDCKPGPPTVSIDTGRRGQVGTMHSGNERYGV